MFNQSTQLQACASELLLELQEKGHLQQLIERVSAQIEHLKEQAQQHLGEREKEISRLKQQQAQISQQVVKLTKQIKELKQQSQSVSPQPQFNFYKKLSNKHETVDLDIKNYTQAIRELDLAQDCLSDLEKNRITHVTKKLILLKKNTQIYNYLLHNLLNKIQESLLRKMNCLKTKAVQIGKEAFYHLEFIRKESQKEEKSKAKSKQRRTIGFRAVSNVKAKIRKQQVDILKRVKGGLRVQSIQIQDLKYELQTLQRQKQFKLLFKNCRRILFNAYSGLQLRVIFQFTLGWLLIERQIHFQLNLDPTFSKELEDETVIVLNKSITNEFKSAKVQSLQKTVYQLKILIAGLRSLQRKDLWERIQRILINSFQKYVQIILENSINQTARNLDSQNFSLCNQSIHSLMNVLGLSQVPPSQTSFLGFIISKIQILEKQMLFYLDVQSIPYQKIANGLESYLMVIYSLISQRLNEYSAMQLLVLLQNVMLASAFMKFQFEGLSQLKREILQLSNCDKLLQRLRAQVQNKAYNQIKEKIQILFKNSYLDNLFSKKKKQRKEVHEALVRLCQYLNLVYDQFQRLDSELSSTLLFFVFSDINTELLQKLISLKKIPQSIIQQLRIDIQFLNQFISKFKIQGLQNCILKITSMVKGMDPQSAPLEDQMLRSLTRKVKKAGTMMSLINKLRKNQK